MTHWTERFFLERPDLFRPALEESVDGADEQVREILELIEDRYDVRPDSVLDVGCGVGRHVTAFAERGIEAHGLDIAAAYTDRARERAESAGSGDLTTFFAKDMREVGDLTERYELLMNVYSFGFFDEATNERLLKRFHQRLHDGGIFLLKTFNKVGRLLNFTESGTNSIGEVTYVRERQYDPLTSRLRSDGFVIENETYLGDYEFEGRLYTPIELAKLITGAGFDDVHQFSAYDPEALTRESGKTGHPRAKVSLRTGSKSTRLRSMGSATYSERSRRRDSPERRREQGYNRPYISAVRFSDGL